MLQDTAIVTLADQ